MGNPHKHLWKYAIDLSDDDNFQSGAHNCPCARCPGRSPPSFVGENYYCETGNIGSLNISEYYTDDPVWDGAGCLVNNNCCANVNQPWFFHQLVTARQDNIAGRLCTRYEFENEAILVEEIQLYVQ